METVESTSAERDIACSHYENCGSPLCPLDSDSLEYGVWYPGEEICRATEFRNLHWLKVQRRIARVRQDGDDYFTAKMLEAVASVHRGIKGIDPSRGLQRAREGEKRWAARRSQIPFFAILGRQMKAEPRGNTVFEGKGYAPGDNGQNPRSE